MKMCTKGLQGRGMDRRVVTEEARSRPRAARAVKRMMAQAVTFPVGTVHPAAMDRFLRIIRPYRDNDDVLPSNACTARKQSKRSSVQVVQVRCTPPLPIHVLTGNPVGRFEIVKKQHEIAVLSLPKVAWRTGDAVTGMVEFHAPGARFDVLKVCLRSTDVRRSLNPSPALHRLDHN